MVSSEKTPLAEVGTGLRNRLNEGVDAPLSERMKRLLERLDDADECMADPFNAFRKGAESAGFGGPTLS